MRVKGEELARQAIVGKAYLEWREKTDAGGDVGLGNSAPPGTNSFRAS